ncbi:MAG TPA: 2-hydroxyacyl-CoA dehydratase [Terriglobales bacterium]|nr:2-hydroxyacyl-CoA dehydratase [Terriglobales bacterium]
MTDLERTFDICQELVADLNFNSVQRWKNQHPGGKAIGYFPVYAPVEIIHAAGMLPVGLSGGGDRLDIQHADARFGSFICSIVKTTLEMGLREHLKFLDGVLFSSICDSARNLCFVLKRNFPSLYIDFLHLPHNPSSEASIDFLTSEYRRSMQELQRMGGRQVSESNLRDAILLYNRNRQLIRSLYAFRLQKPHLLRAWESYVLVRAGNFVPVEEHNSILEAALEQLSVRAGKPRDSIRIVIEGAFCEQPPLDLIKLVEDAGCYVVDDDFVIGRSWFVEDVPGNGDPVRALAESYVNRAVYSSVRHDFRAPRWEGLAQKAKQARADAVLFLIAKFCEPAYFDYVLFKKKLEAIGLPHLLVEFEEKQFTFDRMRTEIETFVESLVFD